MRRKSPNILCFLALTSYMAVSASALGQGTGYPATAHYDGNVVPAGGAHMAPPLPASPLAGGIPAAQGTSFVDAHGQSVVMPASYGAPCYGGGGYPGMGGYGDPMAVDFGGYATEQCGPHYFDVSFGTVFLQGEDLFEGLLPFTSVGVAGVDRFLDVESDFGEYEPGWEIAVRYDIGPLAVVEAAYMGLYDISYTDQVNSVDVAPGNTNFQLFSVFSDYGTGTLINGIDFGQTHAVRYEADLQSTELSYRRYWVGHRPSISGTWMMGARYLRYTDRFAFSSEALVAPADIETANLRWEGENDLVGFQFGGDAWMCLRQGLRMGLDGNVGIYNNRFKFNNSGTFSDPNAPADYSNSSEGNQVAFASEAEASIVADILPSWSLRGGYRVLFINSLVTAENNINQSSFASSQVLTQSGLLFHGFHGGMEYVW